jgi:hypothetical protein
MNAIIEFILSMFKSKQPEQKQEVKPLQETPKVESKPYLITESEILGKVKKEDMPQEHQDNLEVLLERINAVRYAWAKSMKVTSGYRSMADHLRIYAAKGITDQSKIPMKSNHLKCAAVDISDPNKDLQKWCTENVDKLEEIGLWMEAFTATPNWCHFQIYPPKSGNRFFNP